MQYVSQWWSELASGVEHFYRHSGPEEMAIVGGVVLAFGLLCMRGFQVR